MIFSPLKDYEQTLKNTHAAHTQARFQQLSDQSGVNIEANRATVQAYNAQKAGADKEKGRLSRLKTFRVLSVILAVIALIGAIWGFVYLPLAGVICVLVAAAALAVVFWKLNPLIRNQAQLSAEADAKAQKLLAEAQTQMAPLNALLQEEDGLCLLEQTMPLLHFDSNFSFAREKDMAEHFDFPAYENTDRSVLDTLCGTYNGNPFLFETFRTYTMGTEVYHGYKTIHWTEHYRDSKGNRRTRTRSQTLHATITRPKPIYSTETRLHYGAQGSPDLIFSRENRHLENKSDKQVESMVRKGEDKLQDKEEAALARGGTFTAMANTEFEVLFGALNRNHETQFRMLFTPLAQTNMVDLIRSKAGYGDDFDFFKRKRMNTIVSEHDQNRTLRLQASALSSHSYDLAMDNYLRKNEEYFRSIFFDFAPLLAIPVYQDAPVHSMEPPSAYNPHYSLREYEVLANAMDAKALSHPQTKTPTILKTQHTDTHGSTDCVSVTAHSFDALPRVELVPMLGGDGRMHTVSVPWEEYIPLQASCRMTVGESRQSQSGTIGDAAKHHLFACAFDAEY